MNITAATTAELIAFYNANAATPVKRFADRRTAERRVSDLMWKIELTAQYGCDHCPACNIHLSNGVGEHGGDVNGRIIRHKTAQFECLGCGAEFGPSIRVAAASATRSAAIAASWTDADVAKARATRDAVQVTDGKDGRWTFRSVREAFVRLGLPLGQHIRFRGQLKAAREATFGVYEFKTIKMI